MTDLMTTEEAIASELGWKLRQKRNILIAKTDLWGLGDYPATAEQTAYRQALRDITDQAGFPTNITWPEEPSA